MESLELDGRKPHLFVEQKADLDEWIPGGYGTSDAVILCGETLFVIDLKYGKGVPVSAIGNPQLRLYGLGMLKLFQEVSDIDTIRMMIIQPRLDSVSVDAISADELLDWAEKEVKPAAQLAWDGAGEFVPGPKQCQFCRGRYLCVHNAVYQLQTGAILEKQSDRIELTPVEIAGILEKADQLQRWAKGIKEYAQKQALAGEQYPGYKVVRSRSTRYIEDPEKAAQLLMSKGYSVEKLFDLKGITYLEELCGKKELSTLLGDLIQKREGKPTLVAASDPHPALDLRPKEEDYFKGE
jgi:hypothetical protein